MVSSLARGWMIRSSPPTILIAVAKVAPASSISNHRQIQAWLDNRTGIRSIFNHGLFCLIFQVHRLPTPPVLPNCAAPLTPAYFQETLKSGKPVVAQPFISSVNGSPAIAMTAPIHDQQGRMVAIMAGLIDLRSDSGFFHKLSRVRVGSSGYLAFKG